MITQDINGKDCCTECRDKNITHNIKEITIPNKYWESGPTSFIRKCSSCGYEDGPWVKAEDHLAQGWY